MRTYNFDFKFTLKGQYQCFRTFQVRAYRKPEAYDKAKSLALAEIETNWPGCKAVLNSSYRIN